MSNSHIFTCIENGASAEMSSLGPTICRILGIRLPAACDGMPIEETIAHMGKQNRLCLVVIDTFSIYLWRLHQGVTPSLNAMAQDKCLTLRAESPPCTAVNMATIATGAAFTTHKIRRGRDPVRIETILEVMSKCALRTAIAAQEKSALSTLFAGQVTFPVITQSQGDDEVRRGAIECLKDHRPDFLWIHFHTIDDASHTYGPESEECHNAAAQIDNYIKDLSMVWDELYYSALILADHGQHKNPDPGGELKGIHDGADETDYLVPLIWRIAP